MRDDPPTPLSLAWPFAVAGLVGGLLTAAALRPHESDPVSILLVGITPVVAGVLGHFLTSRVHPHGPLRTSVLFVISVVAAGIVNGMIIGTMLGGPLGLLFGVPFGALFSVPFLPVLGLLAVLARRVGRARRNSLVDRADRRLVWTAVGASCALASLMPVEGILGRDHDPREVALPALALALIVALFAADCAALLFIGQLERALRRLRTRAGQGPLPASGDVAVVDMGLGDDDQQMEELAPGQAVYRSTERVRRVFRGDFDEAKRALGRTLMLDIGALLLALSALMARML
ncbi:MAG: hypothetical protein U0359_03740 [Byssovorax sp.]